MERRIDAMRETVVKKDSTAGIDSTTGWKELSTLSGTPSAAERRERTAREPSEPGAERVEARLSFGVETPGPLPER